MGRSSSRHRREIQGKDSADETAPDHGEISNDPIITYPQYYHDFTTKTLGGFTHSRSSDATAPNNGGIIQLYEVDEPAWYKNQGIQLEGARTNLVLDYDDLTQPSWNTFDIETPTTSIETGPRGVAGQYFRASTANADHAIRQFSPATQSEFYAFRWYLKAEAPESEWVQVCGSDGFHTNRIVNVNLNTLAIVYIDLGYNPPWFFVEASKISAGFTEVYAQFNCQTTSPNTGLYLYLCGPSGGASTRLEPWIGPGASGPGVIFDSAYREHGGFPTSDIYTAGSTVTRATVRLEAPTSALPPLPPSGIVGNACGQITFIARSEFDDLNDWASPLYISDGSSNNAIYFEKTNVAGQLSGSVRTNAGTVSQRILNGVSWSVGDHIDIRVSLSDTEFWWSLNGVKTSVGGGLAAFNSPLTTVTCLQNVETANREVFGICEKVRIVPEALTDEQIEAW